MEKFSEEHEGKVGINQFATRSAEQILAKARNKTVSVFDIVGLSSGYEALSEFLGTATPILPNQEHLSVHAVLGFLHLMRPLVTPIEGNKYQLVMGVRGVIGALAHTDITKIPVRVTGDLRNEEIQELALIDLFVLPLCISLRNDANGIGQLFKAFSAREELVPKSMMGKYFESLNSVRQIEKATGIYMPTVNKCSPKKDVDERPHREPDEPDVVEDAAKATKIKGDAATQEMPTAILGVCEQQGFNFECKTTNFSCALDEGKNNG